MKIKSQPSLHSRLSRLSLHSRLASTAQNTGRWNSNFLSQALAATAVFVSCMTLPACKNETPSENPLKGKAEPIVYRQVPTQQNRPSSFETDSPKTLLKGATILTGTGQKIENGFVLMENGRITAVGDATDESLSQGAKVLDVSGKVLTPGLIDTHSHMGVYPTPPVKAHSDGNEARNYSTPSSDALHSFWPQDMSLRYALAGGVTTAQILPGSANIVGGKAVTIRLKVGAVDPDKMMFPDAPRGIKMACGENPKRVHEKKGGSQSRMGTVALHRGVLQKAWEYREKWEKFERDLAHWNEKYEKVKDSPKKRRELGDSPAPPSKNIGYDHLRDLFDGKTLAHIHCYRADDMLHIISLADEFGFKIKSFHHALEAYKIKDVLAQRDISVSSWADWWGFKMEAYDGIPHNLSLIHKAGGKPIVHSDSRIDIQMLNQEAAKARAAGREIGIEVPDEILVKWVTYFPAWALGVEDKIGTLEKGKVADVVIWNKGPFSVYAKAEKVFMEGKLVHDVSAPFEAASDFDLGQRKDPVKLAYDRAGIAKIEKAHQSFLPASTQKDPSLDENSIARRLKDKNEFVVENIYVYTPSENAPELKKVSIHIKSGKIADVYSETAPDKLKNELEVLDAKGSIATPGLIDGQSYVGAFEVSSEDVTTDHVNAKGHHFPNFDIYWGFNPLSPRLASARHYGITSLVARPRGGIISGLSANADLTGDAASLKGVTRASALWANVKKTKGWHESEYPSRPWIWDQLTEIFSEAERLIRRPESFKNPRLKPVWSKNQLSPLVDVLKGKIPVVFEASRFSDIQHVIDLYDRFKKNGHKPRFVISGAEEAVLLGSELAARDIAVILSQTSLIPSGFQTLHTSTDSARMLSGAGVPLIISDGSPSRLRQQAGLAVSAGLSHHAALLAITSTPAQVFGMTKTGKIEKGYVANITLWTNDPLELETKRIATFIHGSPVVSKERFYSLARKYVDR